MLGVTFDALKEVLNNELCIFVYSVVTIIVICELMIIKLVKNRYCVLVNVLGIL